MNTTLSNYSCITVLISRLKTVKISHLKTVIYHVLIINIIKIVQ